MRNFRRHLSAHADPLAGGVDFLDDLFQEAKKARVKNIGKFRRPRIAAISCDKILISVVEEIMGAMICTWPTAAARRMARNCACRSSRCSA
jgi:hypothetical protein